MTLGWYLYIAGVGLLASAMGLVQGMIAPSLAALGVGCMFGALLWAINQPPSRW